MTVPFLTISSGAADAPAKRPPPRLLRQVGHAAWSAAYLLQRRLPPPFYYYFGGIGDELLMSAVFREQVKRGHPPMLVMTAHAALFQNNPDVRATMPVEIRLPELMKRLGRPVFHPYYGLDYDPVLDKHPAPPYPIIARMCEVCGITGDIAVRPYLTLNEDERAGGQIAPRQVAIMSSGLSAKPPFLNKQWYPERFAQVVRACRDQYNFVQLGDASDPLLDGALDLRGQTTLREAAAILSQSRAFVGQIGFLMHLARAVECPSVIVYGGREHPAQSGYPCNENLYSPVPCAPCWQQNRCDFGRKCLSQIHADHVVAALHRLIARAPAPLETEIYTLPPPSAPA